MRTTFLRPAGVVAAGAAALLVAGCTSSGPGASPASSTPISAIASNASHAPATITVWSFNTLPHEVAAFKTTLAKLHTSYPWLTVKFVPGKDDAAFAKAVAAGNPPDVFVSTAPDNVAKFCYNGTVTPLDPYLAAAKINVAKTFPAATLVYTQYAGKQCALPLLVDAYALYYNKKMFAAAGIKTPPKTMSELTADAKKLTVKNSNGTIKTFGFIPRSDYNNNSSIYDGSQSGTQFYDKNGKATFASDPKWAKLLQWDKGLIDWYGAGNVQKFVGTYNGHSDDAKNALLTGAVAMEVDGEWHVGEIASENKNFDYGVAPVPVLDDVASTYGVGNTVGTVAYLPAASKNKQAAFFALQQLTTDTTFLTTLADTVFNIPSTFDSLSAWDNATDVHWAPLVKIFQNPGSYYKQLTPAGDEDASDLGTFIQQYELGKVSNLQSGLASTASKVDKLNAQAKS
jgi:multiple sugar transport system substrate-binding protein